MVTKATAPFQQIKTLVRQNVEAGDWRPGDRIPSELDLAARFGVARMTVNRALRELTEEGVLKRIAGVGTFVAEMKPQSNLLMIAHIRDEIRARGHEYRCRVLSQSSGASFDVAAAFGLPVNTPVFHVVCVHEENGRPIQLEDRYVNPAAAPGSSTRISRSSRRPNTCSTTCRTTNWRSNTSSMRRCRPANRRGCSTCAPTSRA